MSRTWIGPGGGLEQISGELAGLYGDLYEKFVRAATLAELAGQADKADLYWARAARFQNLRVATRQAVINLAAAEAPILNQLMATAREQGISAALADARRLGRKTPGSNHLPLYYRAIEHVQGDLTNALDNAKLRILRWPDDVYRQIIAASTIDLMGGGVTNLTVQQKAWQTLLARGTTGFVDKAGRNWNLATYVEMASRTAAHRAWEEARLDGMRQAGIRYATIIVGMGSCAPCADWSGQILAVDANTPAVAASILTGEPVQVDVDGTVNDWQNQRHPNCRCALTSWQPGQAPPTETTYDPEAEQARADLRKLEVDVRKAKMDAASTLDPEARRAAEAEVRARQKALREHLKDTGLQRSTYREQVNLGHRVTPLDGSMTASKPQTLPVGSRPPLLITSGPGMKPPPVPISHADERHITVGERGNRRSGHLYSSTAGGKTRFPKKWDRYRIMAAVQATVDAPDTWKRRGDFIIRRRMIDGVMVQVTSSTNPVTGEQAFWSAYPAFGEGVVKRQHGKLVPVETDPPPW